MHNLVTNVSSFAGLDTELWIWLEPLETVNWSGKYTGAGWRLTFTETQMILQYETLKHVL